MSSPSRLNRPPVGIFTREDFERAWQPGPPPAQRARSGTAIVVCRNSPYDLAEQPLRVEIDREDVGEIRRGQVVTRLIEPGPHVVTVTAGMFARTLAVDVRTDERVRLRCGRGVESPTWVSRWLPFLVNLRAWLTRE